MVHCMPCIQGSSFTTSYDTSSCIPCSAPCSEDQLLIKLAQQLQMSNVQNSATARTGIIPVKL